MGNDMFNEEQLAYAAEQQASRERNSPPAYILSREAFLRRLHILADTRPSNDGLIPSEVDLSAHDAALRAENERLMRLVQNAETERDRLRERLDQFEAYGMPNVGAALDRVNAAESALASEREAHAETRRMLGLASTHARQYEKQRDEAESRLAAAEECLRHALSALDDEPECPVCDAANSIRALLAGGEK